VHVAVRPPLLKVVIVKQLYLTANYRCIIAAYIYGLNVKCLNFVVVLSRQGLPEVLEIPFPTYAKLLNCKYRAYIWI